MSSAISAGVAEERSPLGSDIKNLDGEVVEVSLLLPRWQAVALSSAARQRGMSAGQMIRRMIGASLDGRLPPVSS